jgi:hypothetical protein
VKLRKEGESLEHVFVQEDESCDPPEGVGSLLGILQAVVGDAVTTGYITYGAENSY